MAHILIVDDESKIRTLVRKYLAFSGHESTEAENGLEAVELCEERKFDLVILDIMMPELDGFSAAREIRKNSDVPIILLSARGEEYDRIHGFELGIDDYVIKPFSPKELSMRVDAILQRGRSRRKEHRRYEKDGFVLDVTAHKLLIDGKETELAPKAYELLAYLVENRNVALSRERILTQVWGFDFFGDDRTLDTHIKLLRKALGTHAASIVTLRGVGYRFDG